MTDAQLQDINSRIDTLTQRVSSLELLTGTIGTSQVAIAQILTVQSQHTETLNRHTQILNSHTADLSQLKSDVSEILRMLRDRNGGTGI